MKQGVKTVKDHAVNIGSDILSDTMTKFADK